MLDGRENPLVQEQYETWVYPEPIDDVAAYFAAGYRQIFDPGACYHRLWPHRARRPFRALVAGCGANQAAIVAYANRDDSFVAIDVSEPSLENTRRLKRKHDLQNLHIEKLSLFDVAQLGEQFDFIVSSGVLHHLPDPLAGCRALAGVLAPEGVMTLMLYGRAGRAGIYMLQEAFREIGLRGDSEGVAKVRSVLAELPSEHAAQRFLRGSRDLTYDAGVVDLFLHPQDRAYSVAEVFDFVEAAGLRFEGWALPMEYDPTAKLSPELRAALGLDDLSPQSQAIFTENFAQSTSKHVFHVTHPGASRPEIRFDGQDWLNYTPVVMPGARVIERPSAEAGGAARQAIQTSLAIEPVDRARALLFAAADGTRSALDCMLAASLSERSEAAAQVAHVAADAFAFFHRRGYMMMKVGDE